MRMVQYKLTYFDGRGTAEIIRQVFAVAKQEFTDVRFSHEEWPKHKAEMPFGQLPVLEVDGKQLAQSFAIVRFLARKFGLAGKTAFDEALVDSMADQIKDFITEIRPFAKVALGFEKGDLVRYLVGDSLTWADLYLAEFAEMEKKVPTLYEGFPEVKAHSDKVRSTPALKKWLATRPQTSF
ncbi:unnamed protein product [Heligmosomoides polygyrus]|uniref:glutathione transferase n=1 Tax=Heligmosomoides polygyrus TaxID=6339 RepID=A0A183G3W8_HELPZ|nr:unnamed protein product [Heligmosomoides polygyrus]